MQHLKLFVTLFLSVLLMIVVMQNTEPVVTKILFISITMPRSVLFFGTTMIGFALGVMNSFMMINRRKDDEK